MPSFGNIGSGISAGLTGASALTSQVGSSAGLAAAANAMQQTQATSAAMSMLSAHAEEQKMVTDTENSIMSGVMDSNTKAISSTSSAAKNIQF